MNPPLTIRCLVLALLGPSLAVLPLRAQTACDLSPKIKPMTLALNRKFVEDHKRRAMVTVELRVDHHPKSPHGISKGAEDGDIHMAGRADEIRLPLVAEIMNAAAKDQEKVRKALDQSSGEAPLEVAGVWRIWFEHPASSGTQVQGEPVEVAGTSNPDHVFEIHPVVTFGGEDIVASLAPIASRNPDQSIKKEYVTASAKTAFASYEGLGARIGATKTAITITTKKAGFNYVSFFLEPQGKPVPAKDGVFVLARVYDESDPDEPLTPSPRRMVFVKDSAAAKALQQDPDQRVKVLGTPRVDLEQVAEIARKLGDDEIATVCLPYEIVVLAVLPEEE
jgi:hypothetical protein